jgi:hypothetical protein
MTPRRTPRLSDRAIGRARQKRHQRTRARGLLPEATLVHLLGMDRPPRNSRAVEPSFPASRAAVLAALGRCRLPSQPPECSHIGDSESSSQLNTSMNE